MSRETNSPHFFSPEHVYHPTNMFMANNGTGFTMNNFGAQMYRPASQQYPSSPHNTTLYFPSSQSCDQANQSSDSSGSNQVNIDSNFGGKPGTKWSDEQSLILVQEWKERLDDVESSRSSEAWKKILEAVNKVQPQKTMKQCKDKLRNLKQAYKDAKANNNLTGRGKKTSPHYEIFDQILGSRPVVTMPGVIQSIGGSESGFLDNSSSSQDSDAELDDGDDEDNDDGIFTEKGKRRKSTPKESKKKARKGKASIQDSFQSLTEKMLEIQQSQMEAMDKAQTRSEELMLKLEMEQRKLDEESRRRDQEFFLRMAQLLKK